MEKVSEQRSTLAQGRIYHFHPKATETDWEIMPCDIRAMGWGGDGAANRDGFGRRRLSWLEVLMFSLLLVSNIGDLWSRSTSELYE